MNDLKGYCYPIEAHVVDVVDGVDRYRRNRIVDALVTAANEGRVGPDLNRISIDMQRGRYTLEEFMELTRLYGGSLQHHEDRLASCDDVDHPTTYGIVMKQDGDGCDHTLACGTKFVTFEADGVADATVEAKRRLMPGDEPGPMVNGDRPGECDLERATLVRVVADLPIGDWFRELSGADARCRREAAERAERAERAELARLLAKHGRPT